MKSSFIKILILFISLTHIKSNDIAIEYEYIANSIIHLAKNDSTAYKRLEYLCDMFGPRLSGSKNLEKAIDWIIREMKHDGLSNVKGERVKVPAWIRGNESLEMKLPYRKNINLLGIGGSIGTPKGGITGEVIVVNNFDELEKVKDEVRGKIVLYNVPFSSYSETVKYRYDGPNKAAEYQAIGSLIRSVGSITHHTIHTGTMGNYKSNNKIPHAAITAEDAMMISRLYNNKQRVVLKLNMEAKFASDRWSRNIIAEINGSKFPNEIVIIGGHIDSWDVGQGAHDDGGGCIAAWHALNIINQLGLKPKRTMRVVLWTNEENGGRGNKNYRDEHLNELKEHIIAIESDGGVFSPRGFGFSGSPKARMIINDISVLLDPINAGNIYPNGIAADTAPLYELGVPVMSLIVDSSKYFWYHHTEADTFDKINFKEFNDCVAAMTIMGFVIADMDQKLPRD